MPTIRLHQFDDTLFALVDSRNPSDADPTPELSAAVEALTHRPVVCMMSGEHSSPDLAFYLFKLGPV